MVQIAQCAKEAPRSTHLVPNDDPSLVRTLDFEELDNGSRARFCLSHDALIDGQSVFGGAFKEGLVGD